VLVPRARDNLGIAKWTPSHQLAWPGTGLQLTPALSPLSHLSRSSIHSHLPVTRQSLEVTAVLVASSLPRLPGLSGGVWSWRLSHCHRPALPLF